MSVPTTLTQSGCRRVGERTRGGCGGTGKAGGPAAHMLTMHHSSMDCCPGILDAVQEFMRERARKARTFLIYAYTISGRRADVGGHRA